MLKHATLANQGNTMKPFLTWKKRRTELYRAACGALATRLRKGEQVRTAAKLVAMRYGGQSLGDGHRLNLSTGTLLSVWYESDCGRSGSWFARDRAPNKYKKQSKPRLSSLASTSSIESTAQYGEIIQTDRRSVRFEGWRAIAVTDAIRELSRIPDYAWAVVIGGASVANLDGIRAAVGSDVLIVSRARRISPHKTSQFSTPSVFLSSTGKKYLADFNAIRMGFAGGNDFRSNGTPQGKTERRAKRSKREKES